MTENQARRYFNSNARYYERGLLPDRRNLYAIHLSGSKVVVAPDTETLWERFWAQVKGGAS